MMLNRLFARVTVISVVLVMLPALLLAESPLPNTGPAAGQESLGTQEKSSNASGPVEYSLLATNRTATMEREMNQAADNGFVFEGAMGGETAFGGSETVAIFSRRLNQPIRSKYAYKLIATKRTSTMQKELSQAGNEGYKYRSQTVFPTTFGGKEVVAILERDRDATGIAFEYKLLATNRTSTMQKELTEAGKEGFQFAGVTVSETSFGGNEVVVILLRQKSR